jgi:hypothetical protein
MALSRRYHQSVRLLPAGNNPSTLGTENFALLKLPDLHLFRRLSIFAAKQTAACKFLDPGAHTRAARESRRNVNAVLIIIV